MANVASPVIRTPSFSDPNESRDELSAAGSENRLQAENSAFSSLLMLVAVLIGSLSLLNAAVPVPSLTPDCATLPPQGQRVSGPGVNMARRRFQQGSVRRRGNRWEVRWREDVVLADGSVKREQRTTLLSTVAECGTKRLAEREAASFLARVNRLDYRPVKRATFSEFAETWNKQVIALLKPSTAKAMASNLRFHLVPAFGPMRLDEIGQEQVQAFVGKLANGRSRHTILNVLGTLASVLSMARKWGYTVAGFQRRDLVIPCSKPGKPGRFFTAEQVRSILALALEPWRTIFALAAMTGLRPGEVLGLSIDDLDFEQRLIFVRRSAWYRHLISPKNARSVATVPMPDPLAEVLTRLSRVVASQRKAVAVFKSPGQSLQ